MPSEYSSDNIRWQKVVTSSSMVPRIPLFTRKSYRQYALNGFKRIQQCLFLKDEYTAHFLVLEGLWFFTIIIVIINFIIIIIIILIAIIIIITNGSKSTSSDIWGNFVLLIFVYPLQCPRWSQTKIFSLRTVCDYRNTWQLRSAVLVIKPVRNNTPCVLRGVGISLNLKDVLCKHMSNHHTTLCM